MNVQGLQDLEKLLAIWVKKPNNIVNKMKNTKSWKSKNMVH